LGEERGHASQVVDDDLQVRIPQEGAAQRDAHHGRGVVADPAERLPQSIPRL
jgi:hypothetical protein